MTELEGLSTLVMRLQLQVIDHEYRPPPGENQEQRRPEEERDPRDPLTTPPERDISALGWSVAETHM